MTYSNPRLAVSFDDWPSGNHRVKCEFTIESNSRGKERCSRRTTQPGTDIWCKPNVSTYADKVRIVDGSDGKTYIAKLSRAYGMIEIQDSAFRYHIEVISDGIYAYVAILREIFQET